MRIIRYGEKGKERPGLLKDRRIVELENHFPKIPDVGPEFFEEGWMEKIRAVDDPGKDMNVRLGPPVTRPEKIICLGKNYVEHAREGGMKVPEAPLLFAKTANALNGPRDPVLMPKFSGQVDWEVELAVVMGKSGKRILRGSAMEHIAGICVMNDVSGRQAQFGDKQWFRGKSFDTFAPLGPALVTPDEIDDINDLDLQTRVNGITMQEGNTKDLLFDVPAIIEFISQDITLKARDIISTGTPSGVGIFRDPPVLLKKGDVVECEISGVGLLVNKLEGP